jgi:CubicO group peptidase (beta-lactamase class C family)
VVTVRQVLQHRSGIPVARSLTADALSATSWHCSVRAVERARPVFPPGQVPAYHILSYGFMLGELVQRVTGTDLRIVLHTELLDPLGLADTHLGLPAPLWPRHVLVHAPGARGKARQLVFNRPRRPAGGHSGGQTDQFLHLPIRWSQGFQLGGPGPDPIRPRPMGTHSSPDAFGHNGSNCCIGWADPARDLVFAYLTNQLTVGLEGSPHQSQVSDALLATCP